VYLSEYLQRQQRLGLTYPGVCVCRLNHKLASVARRVRLLSTCQGQTAALLGKDRRVCILGSYGMWPISFEMTLTFIPGQGNHSKVVSL
jgi:hypothetical protein